MSIIANIRLLQHNTIIPCSTVFIVLGITVFIVLGIIVFIVLDIILYL